ncbi:jg25068 [Pararge aegeria aegeria]|uniref:Jg25068 protein n=1 Tax=Pararge aegeria aegeria TaxID=348720 RepID=A0A8S4QQ32_9NEOP|nr:jg25068 [Pararge aegeria aegeria]
MRASYVFLCIIQIASDVLSVKVKVIMHSDEDSRVEDEVQTESWDYKKKIEITMLPFLRKRHEKKPIVEYEEENSTTEKPRQHPNELLFPLIYRQSHIKSMFKFGENWYTWSSDKRADGSKAINYYICYDEPRHCDEIGWERADTVPNCAFQIEALTQDDRACINTFGIETRPSATCDGGELMKVTL